MNVDWFLQATVDLVMNVGAAHPYIAAFLGAVSGSLTSATAKKIYEKFGDAVIEKLLDKFWDHIAAVYKRAKKARISFHRGDQTILVPPLRISFELNHPSLSEPTALVLVFPVDLTDTQVRDASVLVGKVVKTAIKRLHTRSRYEARARDMIAKGKSAEGMSLLTDEKYMRLRRTPTYAYRPKEKAWVDAWVLADEKTLEENAAILRKAINDPPPSMKGHHKAMHKMLAEIEKSIQDGRVR
ncbi:MAG: hypothetical protein ABSA78_01525 [Candidatus Sulfotelmatobacter sp.]